ncbi:Transposase IS66 family protein (plasmid) [Piscirickettsia salmonis]|nr:Transposase IS66 family protein [Piscirickettsia salmonis]QGP61613.1 Transposase IS66 family protein [Piscirickettsia salmonis]QGP66476.1 Transposase IS66 family protein [Piscirickettsia salmonis]
MECADSRHVTLCDADSRGFIVVAFCSAILHHWMCKIPTEVATLTHFKKDLIMMVIRWYVAYNLSYRDIEELMAERGIQVDHSTIHRWVVKYAPQLEEHFKKRYKRQPATRWHLDETYIKIKGQWYYLYRAIDKYGDT